MLYILKFDYYTTKVEKKRAGQVIPIPISSNIIPASTDED